MIYLDNNATTMMPLEVKKTMIKWLNRGNPSSSYASAVDARRMMAELRDCISNLCKINYNESARYNIIFTSGASESNCTVINGVIDSYKEVTGKTPHIIISAVEHKSIYEMINVLVKRGKITASIIKPSVSGHINPTDVENMIRNNTCLICVMHANNETGAINDIKQIGSIAHKHNIPFHCDIVQTFGKYPIHMVENNIDSCSISFHKIHGPPGIGALIIKKHFLIGYKISPLIFGTQNDGLRGGTENLPGIGASLAALQFTLNDRDKKNKNTLKIKRYIIKELSSVISTRLYTNYITTKNHIDMELILLSGQTDFYLVNTLLLSVVKKTKPMICNVKIKESLEKKGIIVSVGSACNTASSQASHVLYSMNADEFIRKGAIRITLGDNTTIEEADKFVKDFLICIKEQIR